METKITIDFQICISVPLRKLTSINFPSYQNFNDATEANDDFIQKIMVAIDKVAPIKERRTKYNSHE